MKPTTQHSFVLWRIAELIEPLLLKLPYLIKKMHIFDIFTAECPCKLGLLFFFLLLFQERTVCEFNYCLGV